MQQKTPHQIAIVGVGKIARDQHIPSIASNAGFSLAATVSNSGGVEGVENFDTIDELIVQRPEISAVSLCMPPQARFAFAQKALASGKHVLLEKPPGATLSEVASLSALARQKDCVLFAAWHSRFAPAVETAKKWLVGKQISKVEIIWKEDVRRWHPGQKWIWEAGGLGVFDPGINALSILTDILPMEIFLTNSRLEFPANCHTPIAASLAFYSAATPHINAVFDWRHEGIQRWDIGVETTEGNLFMSDGGCVLRIDDRLIMEQPAAEYEGIYARFSQLLREAESDIDVAPLMHVADAFMLGERHVVEAFSDPQ